MIVTLINLIDYNRKGKRINFYSEMGDLALVEKKNKFNKFYIVEIWKSDSDTILTWVFKLFKIFWN